MSQNNLPLTRASIPPAPGRVLVTGGAGFIGSHFVDHVLAAYPGFQVTVVDKLTYAGSIDNLPMERIEFVYGDVCNAGLMDELVGRATHVVHFAAETHVTRSIQENKIFFETDVLGTQALLNACLKHRQKIRQIIHVSTSEVYGSAECLDLMNEEHPLRPMSPYAAAKCGADRLAWSYYFTYRLPIVIVRPFNNYGPRQHVEKMIPRFITSMLLHESMPIHGSGAAERDFVHVSDTVRAIGLLMVTPNRDGDVFNIASGAAVSVLDVAKGIAHLMPGGGFFLPHHLADRPGQVKRHIGDSARLAAAVGWAPAVSWAAGLAAAIDWYIQNQDRWAGQLWARTSVIRTADGEMTAH